MMDLAMNFDADECLVTAMFDKGNRNDTMEAIDHIIPFLKGDADMIGPEKLSILLIFINRWFYSQKEDASGILSVI